MPGFPELSLALFDVARSRECPAGGATCQPRATPWDHGNPRVIRALKGRHTSEIVLPFQGNCGGRWADVSARGHDPQGVALG